MMSITISEAVNKACPFIFSSEGTIMNCIAVACIAWELDRNLCSCGAYSSEKKMLLGKERKQKGGCLRLHRE